MDFLLVEEGNQEVTVEGEKMAVSSGLSAPQGILEEASGGGGEDTDLKLFRMDASQGVGFYGPPGHRNSMCQSREDSSELICSIFIALYKNKDPFTTRFQTLCVS